MTYRLGKLYITPGALSLCEEKGIDTFEVLRRHHQRDWSEMDEHDRKANERALKEGTRVFSAYRYGDEKLYVITEADRSSTLVLLPREY